MPMASQFSDMTLSLNFFLRCFIFLVKFSFWSKFHVNIFTGSGVMTISFYKILTRNPEVGNTPVWGLTNIWRLGQGRTTKFGTNASLTAFTVSELLRGDQQGEGRGKINPTPTQIRVKREFCVLFFFRKPVRYFENLFCMYLLFSCVKRVLSKSLVKFDRVLIGL